jgi:osmoprotectant transport system substrate-binding protein
MHNRTRKLFLTAAGLALAFCMATSGADEDKTVVVGSTNFTEQLILANIYSEVLQDHGIKVKERFNLGTREVVFPALKSGELDVLPEYTGALLSYLSKGKTKETKPKEVLKALRSQLPKGIVALKPSPAQDKDGLVVTQQTAKKYHLQKVSDLKPVANKLTIGGPPELKTRALGLKGLKRVYGIEFANFRPLDAGGPLTQGALSNGAIDVARLFSTEGVISARNWVYLKDDKGLIPADNIIPVARKAALTPKIRKLFNQVSSQLTTEDLRGMNKRASVDHDDPEQIASDWIDKHGLAR